MWGDTQNRLLDVTSSSEKHTEASQRLYPIVKRNLLDKDLPTIPATEVGRHTGVNGQRLCQLSMQHVHVRGNADL